MLFLLVFNRRQPSLGQRQCSLSEQLIGGAMRHGDRNINEVVRVFDALTGFGVDTPFQPVKYGDDTLGQHEAARNVLGEDNWRAIISGQVTIERIGDTLQLKDKPKANK